MNSVSAMSLIGPMISMVFGISFLVVSSYVQGNRRYLQLLAIAFTAFGLAAAMQILKLPADIGHNALLSAALYAVGALTFCEGLLQRSGQRLGIAVHVLVGVLLLGSIYFFYYIDRSLIIRIYVLNLGIGTVFLAVTIKLRSLRRGRPIDRLVWWTLLAFALHFFPRTIITAGPYATGLAFSQSPFWIVLQVSMALFVVVLAIVLMVAAMIDVIDALKMDRDQDVLTGLLNRRGFERQARELLHDFAGKSINLVVCDIDHFKSINDEHGHAMGDKVLKEFARVLQQSLRSIDIVGRVGGEEFVILLPDCDEEGAFFLVSRLRQQMLQKRYRNLPTTQAVTASFGIAGRQLREGLWDWFARADMALYTAKSSGRNRIYFYDLLAGITDRTPVEGFEAADEGDRQLRPA